MQIRPNDSQFIWFLCSMLALAVHPRVALAQDATPTPDGTGTQHQAAAPAGPPQDQSAAAAFPAQGQSAPPAPAAQDQSKPPAPPTPPPPAPSTPSAHGGSAPAALGPVLSESTTFSPPRAPPASAVSTRPAAAIELTSLRLMRERGIISEEDYESALRDIAESVGARASDEATLMLAQWSTTLYGYVQGDGIYDSTRSFNDLAGATLVAQPGTTAGNNGRLQMSIRNSRMGFRMRAPQFHGVRVGAQFEWDFQGTELTVPSSPTTAVSPSPYGTEGAFFSNPVFRVRHLNLKVETPVVDVLVGQYWTLFGWGPLYQPNTDEFQGVPGEVYFRTPQFRLSKTIKAYPVSFEIAAAAVRPFQRDSATPDGQAGLRLAIDSLTGLQTVGQTGTQISPLSVAASGLVRHVAVNDFNAAKGDTGTQKLTMGALAIDAFVPIVPANDKKDAAFSVHGEFTTGYGQGGDMFTNLGGAGTSYPTIAGATTTYATDIDPGAVEFDGDGHLHGLQWTTWLFGAQLYAPGTSGKVWVSGNYSHMQSANSHYYGSAGATLYAEDWFDVNLFVDPVPALRVGAEYANFEDTYVSGLRAIDHRGQLSVFYMF